MKDDDDDEFIREWGAKTLIGIAYGFYYYVCAVVIAIAAVIVLCFSLVLRYFLT